MMFSLLRSLSSVQHEYRFSLEFFLSLFRSAVGQDVEPPSERLEYESDPEDNEDTEEGDKTESRTTIAIKVFASDKYEGRFQGLSIFRFTRLFLRLVYLFLLSMLVSCPHSKNATERKDPHSLVLSISTNKRKT